MRRRTIKIPDELMARLRSEANRRGVTITEVAREALETYLPATGGHRLAAAGTFRSGRSDISERIEGILTGEAGRFRP